MLIHPGRAVDQQCASSCVVWIVVAVHSEVDIFKHLIKGKQGQNEKRLKKRSKREKKSQKEKKHVKREKIIREQKVKRDDFS